MDTFGCRSNCIRPPVPELHFNGRFLADVSTVNNDPQHFDVDSFRQNFHLPYGKDYLEHPNGWWNPNGTGLFSLVSCKITKAVYTDGANATTSASDAAVSLAINDAAQQVQAKLVNLDPEQQGVFEIWGMQVILGPVQQRDDIPFFRSTLDTTSCSDNWTKVPSTKPTPADPHRLGADAGVWQGVLRVSKFHAASSRFMQECEPFLRLSSEDDSCNGLFVIRMNADNFCTDRSSANFPYGRLVGTIRPWLVGYPHFFDAGRLLSPYPTTSQLFNAYAYVQSSPNPIWPYTLHLDIGNALTDVSNGGPVSDFGTLKIGALENGIHHPHDFQLLFTINDYTASGWYENTAGILRIPLNEEQHNQIHLSPLAIVGDSGVLLAEADDGYNVRADTFVFRLNPGDEATASIYVMKFGQRVSDATVTVAFDSSLMKSQATQGPIPGPQAVGVPTAAVSLNGKTDDEDTTLCEKGEAADGRWTVQIETDGDGIAHLKLGASNPYNPRKYIDGQVYGLSYAVGNEPAPYGQMNTSQILNLLVFSGYDIPDNPSWIKDISPIFEQYALLYPAMGRVVNLANYASCMTRLVPLANAFGAAIDDPHYMPVTRDLSENKKQTILRWIGDPPGVNRPLYIDYKSRENLLCALQTAIELEHSTIPPYLCALYSIKPGYNQEVADLIRSIVIEEMLHFAIACNILISIGGKPNINKPGFVPKYPGSLPGGLRRGLIVRLRKCSVEQIRSFMSIEEPREVVVADDGTVTASGIKYKDDKELYTIGFIYDQIKKSLKELAASGKITFGNEQDQVEGWSNPGTLKKIRCLQDALDGIKEIEEQGEGGFPIGTDIPSPVDGEEDPNTGTPELAHYYKFAEIAYGKRIVIHSLKPKVDFSYSGDSIIIDPAGVYPMMDDPDIAIYNPGSMQREALQDFARKYRAVLNGLHTVFNRTPDYLVQAIASMFQLTISAERLMKMDSGRGDNSTVGLSFQLPFNE